MGGCVKATHPTLKLITKRTENCLVAQGWIGNKACLVTIDTGACVTVARPDNVAGCLERKPSQCYRLTTVSGESPPILKKALVELTLGLWP
jgi:hypothetical protein